MLNPGINLTRSQPCRWLIDTDRDAEGMRVLADLHGGDLEDPAAIAEFREIRGKVHEEVSRSSECCP